MATSGHCPEALWEWGMWPQEVAQFSWTNTLSNRLRLEGSLDIYNVFNANDVMRVNSTFGGAWLRPLRNAYAGGAILTGRWPQVSGRLSF